jgi:hypothetical protein
MLVRLVSLIIVLVFLTAGCGKKDKVSSKDSLPAAQTKKKGAAGRAGEGNLSVQILPESPRVTDSLRALVSRSDGTCTFSWSRNGNPIDGETGDTLPDHNFAKGDEIGVKVASGPREAQASTMIGNSPPEVISVPFADPYAHHGVDLVVEPEAIDPDGDPVTFRYTWMVNGEEVTGSDSPILGGDEFQKGDRILLKIVPSDGENEGPEFQGKEFDIPDAPPRFVSSPSQEFKGFSYEYDALAEDADGDEIAYSLETGPPGMTVDPKTGKVSWAVGKAAEGEIPIKIVARDPEGMKAVQEYTLFLQRKDGE